MQIICVSRGSFSKGKELAEALAAKLDYQCVSREELVDGAINAGIPVGKLETAMLKPHIFNEQLVLTKEHFQAFSTVYLLERALKKDLVYHGRTGHLLFPGISNILRTRVVADQEYRIDSVVQRLNLSWEKAKTYVQDVDDDHARWVKMYYGVHWDEAIHYDVVLNLEQWGVENASAALCSMAQLPDFQVTPASRKAIGNLLLASRARLALAEHESTYRSQLKVRADDGVVSVTYPPQQPQLVNQIPKVLEKVEGVQEILCTMAQTNIIWIQERYDPKTESFKELVSLAQKWDAAIELLRLNPVEEDVHEVEYVSNSVDAASGAKSRVEYDGGIEDDVEEKAASIDDGGLNETLTELVRIGRSGGGRSVRTRPRRLIESIDHTIEYSLVVVGEVFLSKGHAAQTRMARELSSLLHDKMRVPVVMADELKQQYLFGARQLVRLLIFLSITALVYFAVFTHQVPILSFLHGETQLDRIIAAVCVFVFVPVIAYAYGTAARLFLKLLRIE